MRCRSVRAAPRRAWLEDCVLRGRALTLVGFMERVDDRDQQTCVWVWICVR